MLFTRDLTKFTVWLAFALSSVSCSDKRSDTSAGFDTGLFSSKVPTEKLPIAPPIDLSRAATFKSWRVIKDAVAIGPVVANKCDVVSPASLLDESGDYRYGGLFVVIKGDSLVSVGGSGVEVLFQSVRGVILYTNADSLQLSMSDPVETRSFLTKLSTNAPSHLVAYLRYSDGEASKINFPMVGFAKAMAAQRSCARAAQGTSAVPANSKNPFSLKQFLQSDLARQNGITATDGWALKDGLYNNELKVPREPELSFEMSTRQDEVIEFSLMTVGALVPDEDQLALMNSVLLYAANAVGSSAKPHVSARDFLTRYHQINEAKANRKGRLILQTGSVGGDATLWVKVSR